MGTITENTAAGNATRITEEKMNQYQDDLRRARLIRCIADQMVERGILSIRERQEFLRGQAEKYSLDPLLLTR